MILRPVRPQSPSGPPMTKRPVGLTWYLVRASRYSCGNDLLDDLFDDRLAQGFVLHVGAVLRRHHDGVDAARAAVAVLDGDLRFRVGAQEA